MVGLVNLSTWMTHHLSVDHHARILNSFLLTLVLLSFCHFLVTVNMSYLSMLFSSKRRMWHVCKNGDKNRNYLPMRTEWEWKLLFASGIKMRRKNICRTEIQFTGSSYGRWMSHLATQVTEIQFTGSSYGRWMSHLATQVTEIQFTGSSYGRWMSHLATQVMIDRIPQC